MNKLLWWWPQHRETVRCSHDKTQWSIGCFAESYKNTVFLFLLITILAEYSMHFFPPLLIIVFAVFWIVCRFSLHLQDSASCESSSRESRVALRKRRATLAAVLDGEPGVGVGQASVSTRPNTGNHFLPRSTSWYKDGSECPCKWANIFLWYLW